MLLLIEQDFFFTFLCKIIAKFTNRKTYTFHLTIQAVCLKIKLKFLYFCFEIFTEKNIHKRIHVRVIFTGHN